MASGAGYLVKNEAKTYVSTLVFLHLGLVISTFEFPQIVSDKL